MPGGEASPLKANLCNYPLSLRFPSATDPPIIVYHIFGRPFLCPSSWFFHRVTSHSFCNYKSSNNPLISMHGQNGVPIQIYEERVCDQHQLNWGHDPLTNNGYNRNYPTVPCLQGLSAPKLSRLDQRHAFWCRSGALIYYQAHPTLNVAQKLTLLILIAQNLMIYRLFDPRVGFTPTVKTIFADNP